MSGTFSTRRSCVPAKIATVLVKQNGFGRGTQQYSLSARYKLYIYTVIYLYSIDNMRREREAVTHTYYHSISSGHLREIGFSALRYQMKVPSRNHLHRWWLQVLNWSQLFIQPLFQKADRYGDSERQMVPIDSQAPPAVCKIPNFNRIIFCGQKRDNYTYHKV